MGLSRSASEFTANGGWSAYLFLEHFKYFTERYAEILEIDVGRSVIHLTYGGTLVKLYVHRHDRSHEWVTLTDAAGVELESAHHLVTPAELTAVILKHLGYVEAERAPAP